MCFRHGKADAVSSGTGSRNGVIWEVVLPPGDSGDLCYMEVKATPDSTEVTLISYYYGDVYFCSGQSNMVWPMFTIVNSTEEIAASAGYSNIR